MKKATTRTTLALQEIPFKGCEPSEVGVLIAGMADGEIWLPLRRLCEAIGVGYEALENHFREKTAWATLEKFPTKAAAGKLRQEICINLETLTLWLRSVERADIRYEAFCDKLMLYKAQAVWRLRGHFFGLPTQPSGRYLHRGEQMLAIIEHLREGALALVGLDQEGDAQLAQLRTRNDGEENPLRFQDEIEYIEFKIWEIEENLFMWVSMLGHPRLPWSASDVRDLISYLIANYVTAELGSADDAEQACYNRLYAELENAYNVRLERLAAKFNTEKFPNVIKPGTRWTALDVAEELDLIKPLGGVATYLFMVAPGASAKVRKGTKKGSQLKVL